jgi:hypothetical protein
MHQASFTARVQSMNDEELMTWGKPFLEILAGTLLHNTTALHQAMQAIFAQPPAAVRDLLLQLIASDMLHQQALFDEYLPDDDDFDGWCGVADEDMEDAPTVASKEAASPLMTPTPTQEDGGGAVV